MKIPPLGWAFFGLAVVALGWHVLTGGVYVGSGVQEITRPYGEAFLHKCSYLFTNGIHQVIYPRLVIPTREQATAADCPPTSPPSSINAASQP